MNKQLLAATMALGLGAGSSGAGEAHGHWATVNGHKIYYELHGAGSPLLLLHGGGSDVEDSFGKQLEPFAQAHRIIAPEQVGQGHTPDVPGPLSYTRMTEDTAELLRQLHLKNVDVVGFSDGGILALMLALRYPELVRRLVVTGVNLDPSGLIDSDPPDTPGTPDTPDAAAQVEQPAQAARPDETAKAADAPNPEIPLDDKLMELWRHYPDATELSPELLKGLHKRVLVMAGDQDMIKLEHILLIYRSLPDAQLWILPGTGHDTFSARWEWVNAEVLTFLDEP